VQNLLLIGAGQLGARYAQGIAKENISYNITVIDPSSHSLSAAKKKWVEAGGDCSCHKIFWSETLPENIKTYDLAIIATSSKKRALLIKDIALKINIKYWVLEKILAQSSQELSMIKSATYNAKGVYVNTPRRQMSFYQNIKSKFPNKPLQVKKTGGLWGLACNAIHFIDLVAWWTGESLVSIDTKRLHTNWFKSKRKGYFEVTGELLAKFSGRTELSLHSSHDAKDEALIVEFSNKDSCTIYENKGTALFSNGDVVNESFKLQSEMTGVMIRKILTEGTCDLPTLQESSKLHAIFLDAMLEHWNRSNNLNDKLTPIT